MATCSPGFSGCELIIPRATGCQLQRPATRSRRHHLAASAASAWHRLRRLPPGSAACPLTQGGRGARPAQELRAAWEPGLLRPGAGHSWLPLAAPGPGHCPDSHQPLAQALCGQSWSPAGGAGCWPEQPDVGGGCLLPFAPSACGGGGGAAAGQSEVDRAAGWLAVQLWSGEGPGGSSLASYQPWKVADSPWGN